MENVSPLPSLPTPSTGLGIDLGTTLCSVAVFRLQNAVAKVIESGFDKNSRPSYAASAQDEECGKDAEIAVVAGDTCKYIAFTHPENTVFHIKRLIGGIFENSNNQKYQKLWPFLLVNLHGFVKFRVNGDPTLSKTFAIKLISHLKKTAEDKLGHSVTSAVVTVPAYFTDLHKGLTKDACEEAGFENIQIIAEPEDRNETTECLFHKPTSRNGTNACPIHDLGGRTFKARKRMEIRNTGCDGLLDTEDVTNLFTECCVETFKKLYGANSVDGKHSKDVKIRNQTSIGLREIKKEFRIQKCSLASTSSAASSLDSACRDAQQTTSYAAVERTIFQNLIRALFSRSKNILDNTLEDSVCEKQEIHVEVLMGVLKNIPKVQKTIQWTHKIDGFPSTSAHAAVAIGNKIYSIGGINYPVNPFYSVVWPIDIFVLDVHEPEMGWNQVLTEYHKSIPNQLCGHTAVAYKGCVIIFGGFDTKKGKSVNSTFLLNTETRKWRKPNVSGSIPKVCYDHTAVVLGDELIVFGGVGGTNDLHSLNLETFVWSTIQTKGIVPPILSGHSATVYKDRFMLVFGGMDSSKSYLKILMSFDFKNQIWTKLQTAGAPPKGRAKHCAFTQNGLLYIFGGTNKKHSFLNDLFAYNPETFSWAEVVPIGEAPSPRADAECVVLDEQVFIFGGFCRIYYDVLLDDTTVLEI